MAMVKFGGQTGMVRDPATGSMVRARCMGIANSDQAEAMVRTAVLHGVTMALAKAGGSLIAAAAAPDVASVAAEAKKMLGGDLTIESLTVTFAAQDLALLQRGQG